MSLEGRSMENVLEFSELYRLPRCEESRQDAAERVQKQILSGRDLYNGPITQYSGKKIIRFIQNVENCTPVWIDGTGMFYDYYLRVQVAISP
jgi:hypothetical protein